MLANRFETGVRMCVTIPLSPRHDTSCTSRSIVPHGTPMPTRNIKEKRVMRSFRGTTVFDTMGRA